MFQFKTKIPVAIQSKYLSPFSEKETSPLKITVPIDLSDLCALKNHADESDKILEFKSFLCETFREKNNNLRIENNVLRNDLEKSQKSNNNFAELLKRREKTIRELRKKLAKSERNTR